MKKNLYSSRNKRRHPAAFRRDRRRRFRHRGPGGRQDCGQHGRPCGGGPQRSQRCSQGPC